MSYNHHLPQKIDLKPKRHHGFQFLLFILGWLLPPLAVAARFGIGKDFFINIFLTICGYFPGHGHNFYIQNIRNNSNKARTPKWAIRYGLVSGQAQERKARKSQWAKRYDERLSESTHVGQELAEGEVGNNYVPYNEEDAEARRRHAANQGLWTRDEEEFYNEDPDAAPNQRNWHYPANFEGTIGDGRSKRRAAPASSSSSSGDRWERARAARRSSGASSSTDSFDNSNRTTGASTGTYPPGGRAATDDDVPEWGRDYGSKGRRSSRGKPKKSSPDDVFSHEF